MDEATENATLRINEIRTADEGEYKCEITFLDITKNCPVVQLVKLTTLGKSSNTVDSAYNIHGYKGH